MFTIDDSLSPDLYPLAFMLGQWRGTGVLGYANIDQTPFQQEIEFSHDGGPYLEYHSRILTPGDASETETGAFTRVWSVESGYWRVAPDIEGQASPTVSASTPHPNGMPGPVVAPLEVMISEPTGHLTLLIGEVNGARIDLVSDAIVRTATGVEITAMKRLYGLVEGQLMWATDMAAFGNPMASYASARLDRVIAHPETPGTERPDTGTPDPEIPAKAAP